jgi:methionine-rich copper-binding protein CopC
MPRFTFVGRTIAVVALATATVIASVTTVSAHAGIDSSSPVNGAQLSSSPVQITLKFAETVKLDGTESRLINQKGNRIKAKVTTHGKRVVFVPAVPLPAGRFAAAWHLVSADGDAVEGAISFTVATHNITGTPVPVTTSPKVPTTLSTALPGARVLMFTTKARAGEVQWTSSKISEPITWTVKGDGTKAAARGVLPTSGTWNFTATLNDGSAVLIVKGKVTLGK